MDDTFYVQIGTKTIYTTVTSKSNTIADWINGVSTFFRNKRTVVFGLDIEGKPKWGRSQNPVATLQICAANRCLIIQLIHLDCFPSILVQFLVNPRHLFAGVEIDRDAMKLDGFYGLIFKNQYDLRKEALGKCQERLSKRPGLKELAIVVAGVNMEKPKRVCSSDWDLKCLSYEQVEYACLDAYACHRIGLTLFFDHQWACSPSTCAYIQCQEHVLSTETSGYY